MQKQCRNEDKLCFFRKKSKKSENKNGICANNGIRFFIIIMIGTFLLMLPISNQDGNWCDFLDAMFTATRCNLCDWSCRV